MSSDNKDKQPQEVIRLGQLLKGDVVKVCLLYKILSVRMKMESEL